MDDPAEVDPKGPRVDNWTCECCGNVLGSVVERDGLEWLIEPDGHETNGRALTPCKVCGHKTPWYWGARPWRNLERRLQMKGSPA